MLRDGNGEETYQGIYERERLRRMARKLGLRLVKSDRSRPQQQSESSQAALASQSATHESGSEAKALLSPALDLDKCG